MSESNPVADMRESASANTRVFVFGTLKQGFPNFHHNPGQRWSGNYATVERYPLYLVGQRRSPWLIDQPGEGYRVSGEVYQVDQYSLQQLDQLERIAEPDGYRRQAIEVSNASADKITVQVYLKSIACFNQQKPISGPHAAYNLELAAQYRPRG